MGSGLDVAVGPPTKTSGHDPSSTFQTSSGSSSLAAHVRGSPDRCIISSTFTALSSYARDIPSASKCFSGRLDSTAKSWRFLDLSSWSMSSPGRYARSHSIPGWLLRMVYSTTWPRLEAPTS